MIGLAVLSSTSEVKVVRNYLVALWIADIGHIALTWHALGHENFTDIARWNAMTWGNIGATVCSPANWKNHHSELTARTGIPLPSKNCLLFRGIRP